MVEMWEIEWNSSMINHGVDMGTMEYIFAKGGTLKDFNYVMLDTNDDTWEPLIKAVAERDNSHPDIIRKNVPANAAPGFFGVPDTYRPAAQMEMNPVGGQSYSVAAQTPRQARQLLGAQRVAQSDMNLYHAGKDGTRPAIRDLARTGQYGAAVGQGMKDVGGAAMGLGAGALGLGAMAAGGAAKRIAPFVGATQGGRDAYRRAGEVAGKVAGGVVQGTKAMARDASSYLSRKFPGVRDRMKTFATAIKNPRQAYGAMKDAYAERRDRKEGRSRRELLESEGAKRQTQSDRAVPGSEGYDAQMGQYDSNMANRMNLNQGKDESEQDALQREIREIGASQATPRAGFRGALDQRLNPPAQEEEEEIQDPLAGIEETPQMRNNANADATPKLELDPEETPKLELDPEGPVVTPPPSPATAGPPEVAQVTEPQQPEALPEEDLGPQFAFGDQMATAAGYAPGNKGFRNASEVARGMFNKPEGGMEAITGATGSRGYRTKLAESIAAHHGITPAQATQVVQAAQQGNPEAKQVVEQLQLDPETETPKLELDDDDDDMMALSEGSKHYSDWESLMKGLNIR